MKNRSKSFKLVVDGMKCASCVAPLEKALKSLAGVEQAQVNFLNRIVSVQGDVSVDAVKKVIESQGYVAQLADMPPHKAMDHQHDMQGVLIKLIYSLVAAVI